MAARIAIVAAVVTLCCLQVQHAAGFSFNLNIGRTSEALASSVKSAQAKLTDAASNSERAVSEAQKAIISMSPDNMLAKVLDIQQGLQEQAVAVSGMLDEVIDSAEEKITSTVQENVQKWEGAITGNSAVQAAANASINITSCAADRIAQLAAGAAKDTLRCATDRIREARNLVRNIVGLVPRSVEIVQNATTAVKDCSAIVAGEGVSIQGAIDGTSCGVREITPLVLKSASMAKDAAISFTRATVLVATLREQVLSCLNTVMAKKAFEATKTGAKIAACAASKTAGRMISVLG